MTLDREKRDDDDAPAASLGTLCAPFVTQTDVTGASISIFDSTGRQSTVCASDAVAARIEEVQLEIGAGPQQDVLRTADAVFLPDVRSATLHPELGTELQRLEVGALFSLPLTMGAVTVGVVSLYRVSSGGLSSDDLRTVLSLAAVTSAKAVRQALTSALSENTTLAPAAVPEMRREVHQATGMLMIHLDTDATEAFARLRAHAFSSGRTVSAVARDVVAGTLDFRTLD